MIFKNIPFILRRFSRQKLTTSLHIVGLTLGITVCLLIGLFVKYELSFDAYENKADRTYRLNTVWVDFGKKEFHYSTPFPLADQIRKIFGLENVTKVHHLSSNSSNQSNQKIQARSCDDDRSGIFDVLM
jgi:hypothetical protein